MRSLPVLFASVCLASAPAAAMTFTLDGDTVRASGRIEQGDADRLRTFFGRLERDEMNYLSVAVALNSPGGNLLEGMRIGMAIRDAGVPTLVRQGETCASACAIAFLGGQASGVTSNAVSRNLEPGALLGYHGFYTGGDQERAIVARGDRTRCSLPSVHHSERLPQRLPRQRHHSTTAANAVTLLERLTPDHRP